MNSMDTIGKFHHIASCLLSNAASLTSIVRPCISCLVRCAGRNGCLSAKDTARAPDSHQKRLHTTMLRSLSLPRAAVRSAFKAQSSYVTTSMADALQASYANLFPDSQQSLPLQQLRDGRSEDTQQKLVSFIDYELEWASADKVQRKGI